MTDSRSLLRVVQEDVSNNIISKLTLTRITREAIHKNMLNRVFDNVPNLLDPDQRNRLGERYIAIIADTRCSNDDALTPNLVAATEITKWTKELISIAMSELLDADGTVKNEIINYFGWGDLRDRLDKARIVSAYVGAVSAYVQKKYEADIVSKYGEQNAIISNFINKHYPAWLKDVMAEKGLTITAADMLLLTGVVGVVGVASVAAGLLLGAVLLYGLFANSGGEPAKEDRAPSPRRR